MAECPFCFAVLSTNDILRGKLKACPKCGKSLGLGVPSAPAAAAPPAPVPPRAPLKSTPPPPILQQAKKYRDPEDNEENTPAPRAPAPALKPRQQPDDDEDETGDGEQPSALKRLAQVDPPTLAGFFLVSFAFLLASLPSYGWLGKMCAGVGIVVALVGSLLPAFSQQKPIVFPSLIVVLGLVVVAFLGNWPRVPRLGPVGPTAIPLSPHATEGPQPVTEDQWLDASVAALRDKGLLVYVGSVKLLPVDKLGKAAPGKLTGNVLVVQVRVNNEDPKLQPLTFETWADGPAGPSKHPAVLTDSVATAPLSQIPVDISKLPDDPNRVTRADVAAAPPEDDKTGINTKKFAVTVKAPPPPRANLTTQTLAPGRAVSESLFFPAPPAEATYLRLELPASALGLEGRFRFHIPRTMIQEP
jgi:hypothetical protein